MATRYQMSDASERNQARARGNGKTLSGHQLWTTEEDDIVRKHYPDHGKLKKLLRHRTAIAIRARGIKIKALGKKQSCWTANEVSRLRKRWRDAPRAELIAEFPRHSWIGIQHKGRAFGIKRRPWRPKRVGLPMLDEIRRRAADLGITLGDLDRICSAGRYFAKSSQGYRPSRNVWLRAVKALGGRVEIIWL